MNTVGRLGIVTTALAALEPERYQKSATYRQHSDILAGMIVTFIDALAHEDDQLREKYAAMVKESMLESRSWIVPHE